MTEQLFTSLSRMMEQSAWPAMVAALCWGVLSILLSPCHLASIPLVVAYVNRLVRSTRNHVEILLGASPRAGVTLLAAAKTLAAFDGRDYVLPDDVKRLFLPVLRHRIVLRPSADLEMTSTDRVLEGVLANMEVPR